jgi:hypothetical protein
MVQNTACKLQKVATHRWQLNNRENEERKNDTYCGRREGKGYAEIESGSKHKDAGVFGTILAICFQYAVAVIVQRLLYPPITAYIITRLQPTFISLSWLLQ